MRINSICSNATVFSKYEDSEIYNSPLRDIFDYKEAKAISEQYTPCANRAIGLAYTYKFYAVKKGEGLARGFPFRTAHGPLFSLLRECETCGKLGGYHQVKSWDFSHSWLATTFNTYCRDSYNREAFYKSPNVMCYECYKRVKPLHIRTLVLDEHMWLIKDIEKELKLQRKRRRDEFNRN